MVDFAVSEPVALWRSKLVVVVGDLVVGAVVGVDWEAAMVHGAVAVMESVVSAKSMFAEAQTKHTMVGLYRQPQWADKPTAARNTSDAMVVVVTMAETAGLSVYSC